VRVLKACFFFSVTGNQSLGRHSSDLIDDDTPIVVYTYVDYHSGCCVRRVCVSTVSSCGKLCQTTLIACPVRGLHIIIIIIIT
jgi:hypothetical protein